MTKEEEFVVNPLIKWFKSQKANWKLYQPNFGTAATGWDIEAQRKNQDLLIEAKYIDGPFLASLNGLVTAPLANRPQHLIKENIAAGLMAFVGLLARIIPSAIFTSFFTIILSATYLFGVIIIKIFG